MNNKTKVIIITGPTGVGKTKLSIEIAKLFNTEIINGDAFQVYDKMFIGTSSPTKEEKETIIHHLFNFINPIDSFSVCDYQKIVRNKIDEFINSNKIPLIVGGSGLYIDSLIADYRFDTPKHNKNIEELYSKYSNEELYQELLKLNPNIDSNIIHMNNRKRVIRAIENLKSGNYSSNLLKNNLLYDALVIFLTPTDRDILYKRINSRVDQMIEEGLIEEVQFLYKNKILGDTSSQAIGYKELVPYFENNDTLESCIDKIKQSSRHYAKRQITWFKHKEYTKFISVDYNNFNNTINEVKLLINDFLNNK